MPRGVGQFLSRSGPFSCERRSPRVFACDVRKVRLDAILCGALPAEAQKLGLGVVKRTILVY